MAMAIATSSLKVLRRPLEPKDVALGEAVPFVVAAHMMDERAAAAFALRRHDLDAVAVEQADGGVVVLRFQHRLRAAAQDRDARAALAFSGEHARPVSRRARRRAGG